MKETVKKIAALFLTVTMCGSMLAACNSQTPDPTDSGATGGTESTQSSVEPTTDPSETGYTPPEDRDYLLAEDYLADPSLFVPAWEGEWTVPEGMLDFEEKWEQFFTPNGRTMSIAHRGDRNEYYPENSIEGILSAIMAGADMVEIDLAKTKDGQIVVIHDDELLGTTDLALQRLDGANLPESNRVVDWTLEELRQLHLTFAGGIEVTDYVIPTLKDVLMVCNNRVFVTLDKVSRVDWNLDIYPIIEEVGAYRSVLVPYNYTATVGFGVVELYLKRIKNASGMDAPFMARARNEELASVTEQIVQFDFPRVLRGVEYSPDNLALYTPYLGNFRVYAETLVQSNDNEETWAEMDALGYNLIMSNNDIYKLTQFIAKTYFSS